MIYWLAITLPVLLLFSSFVMDVGNWFVHKRHLQLQVDAGVFAGGGLFSPSCSDDVIEAVARKYAGDPVVTDAFNPQYTHSSDVHVLVNSISYWNEGGTDHSDGGGPCETKFLDLKATHVNLPFLIPFAGSVVPAINAHARIEIRQQRVGAGALPIAYPDVDPKELAVTFVDETTSPPTTLRTVSLTRRGRSGDLIYWDNADAPASIPISSRKIGVRVAMGDSTTCSTGFVACYDYASPNGILYIRGWSGSGTAAPNAPIARHVRLFSGNCADPQFTYSRTTACTIGVVADVDFGVPNPRADPPNAKGVARIGGAEKQLVYSTSSGLWESSTSNASFFTVSPASGPLPVELKWQTSGSQGGAGTFGIVQRHFSGASARSGPVNVAQLWTMDDPAVPRYNDHSFELDSTHQFVVRIGLPPSIEIATSESSPKIYLRVAGSASASTNESQTQALDCDPALSDWVHELELGCAPGYTRNSVNGDDCPNTGVPGADEATLWARPQPWTCVSIDTGQHEVKVGQGLNQRILGSIRPLICTAPNNWGQFDETGIAEGDPRVVQLFLTPWATFLSAGDGTLPVTGFAMFYVTGWQGNGVDFLNPCQGNGDDDAAPGVIVGHFIKYVNNVNNGAASELCDFAKPEPCVAVLVE